MKAAGAHAQQQRAISRTEFLPNPFGQLAEVLADLPFELFGVAVTPDQTTGFDADHETGWNRKVERRHHVAQVRALLAEQLLQLVELEFVWMVEGVDARHVPRLRVNPGARPATP